MDSKPNCEMCARDGETVESNNQVDGEWLCIPCIECHNAAMLRSESATNRASSINNLERRQMQLGATKQEPVVLPQRVKDAASLVENLSFVLDGLIGGTITVEQANTACKVTNEITKVLELQHRLSNSQK